MSALKAPVALIGFNRPDTVRRVFAAVRAARPERLFLIADGPRDGCAGEDERCAEVRRILTGVNWPCAVETNFAEMNMGCRPRIVSGLKWVFERTEEAIILEDDCLPDASFFPFCAELLDRYRDRPEVAFIAGFNPLEREFRIPWSYAFSQVASTWGWATWRRAWQEFDEHLTTWPAVRESGLLQRVFPQKRAAMYWTSVYDRVHAGMGPSAWDYQWAYACWTHNWLAVVPQRNLVQNIGAGEDATHTRQLDRRLMLEAKHVEMPLRHPPALTPWPEYVRRMQNTFFSPSLAARAWRKAMRLAGRG
jgi:hypothetical protein